tara:strand:- start:45580 stop:46107 length:528 start_codon:yes stop_codon:yes gene_type:complete
MYNYEKRLTEISLSLTRMRSKRVGIIKISNEIKMIEQDDHKVLGQIKSLQDAYFNKRTVPRRVYLKRIKGYKLRRTEIEKAKTILEEKLARKEKLEEYVEQEKRKKRKKPKKPKQRLKDVKDSEKHSILDRFDQFKDNLHIQPPSKPSDYKEKTPLLHTISKNIAKLGKSLSIKR